MDAKLGDRADGAHGAGVISCLDSSDKKGDDAAVLSRQEVRRRSGSAGGADSGQGRAFQQRLELPGLGIEDEDRRLDPGEAAKAIPVKERNDLYRQRLRL